MALRYLFSGALGINASRATERRPLPVYWRWRAWEPRQLARIARDACVGVPAVQHERHVLLGKTLAQLFRIPVTETEVEDRGSDATVLNEITGGSHRLRHSYGGTRSLEPGDDVESDERFILDEKDGVAS